MLHSISHFPLPCGEPHSILRYVAPEDVVVLLQDGVIFGLSNTESAAKLLGSGAALYALHSDLAARGLLQHIERGIEIIDHVRLVSITDQHRPQISW